MEELKENLKNLQIEQQKALKSNNLCVLNEINKKIFAIREEIRKLKAKERQKKNDDDIDKKIYDILAK